MPGGGRLTIETGNRWIDDREARIRDVPPGQYISLCVSDTGTGMPPEVIRRAFDPFFTTKPAGTGTGLGLSMVYGFVRQSGGLARIYSEVGRGSMVCLYLPRFIGEETSDEPPDTGFPLRAGDGETVLVVDDEASVRMLAVEVLGDLGYTALEAEDGPAALQILGSDVRLDLLVTDVGLPGGMTGRQLAEAARGFRPGLKVLFITRLRRERRPQSRAPRSGHAYIDQAVRDRCAGGKDQGSHLAGLDTQASSRDPVYGVTSRFAQNRTLSRQASKSWAFTNGGLWTAYRHPVKSGDCRCKTLFQNSFERQAVRAWVLPCDFEQTVR